MSKVRRFFPPFPLFLFLLLFLFQRFVLAEEIGWIAGRVLSILDDSPISGAKIEIFKQELEKLPDGSFSVKELEKAVPLGIIVSTDEQGGFKVKVPLGEEPNYFVVVVYAEGYEKMINILTHVKSGEQTYIVFELIPSHLTPEQMKIIDKKIEEKRKKLRKLTPSYQQDFE